MLAISIRNLSFTYRGGKGKAIDGINFDQERGEFVTIMGRSGAGKSTLCRCLNNLIPNFQKGDLTGQVLIFGRRTEGMSVSELAGEVGMVFQDFEAQLFSTNVELEVAFGPENFGVPRDEIRRRVKEALDLVGLSGFEKREPMTLSGGEKQRLAIASALAIKPKILVMDEPTTDLDSQGREELLSLFERLREQGITLLLVEHESEEVLNTDRVAIMDEGRIIRTAPPKEMFAEVESLERHGIRPPQVAELMMKLGYKTPPFKADEAYELLRRDGWTIDEGKLQEILAKDEVRETGYGDIIFDLKDLSYVYENGFKALDGINLNIREGEFVAVIGQNGSGKTTLVKHLNGLLRPTKGDAVFLGKSVKRWRRSDIGKLVGFVFQNPDHQIFANTVREEVSFSPRNYGFSEAEVRSSVEEALRAVELEGYEEMSPFLLTKGERQRVALASVLACKPRVIILDEPTTGLDYHQQRRIMELLRRLNEEGHTIIIVTHSLWGVAEYAHRIILLRKGRLVADGPVREVFADEGRLRKAGLKPPKIVELGGMFGTILLSVEELKSCLRRRGTDEVGLPLP